MDSSQCLVISGERGRRGGGVDAFMEGGARLFAVALLAGVLQIDS